MTRNQIPTVLAGMGFAAAVLVEALALPGGANSSDPPTTVATYYVQHGGTDLVSDYLSLIATPLLLAFFCALAARVAGTAQRFAVALATIAATFELAATAVEISLAGSVARTAPATTTAALFQLSSRLFFVSILLLGLATATITFAAPASIWQRGLGALASLVLTAAGLGAAHPHGPLGGLIFPAEALLVIWVITNAVTTPRRPTVANTPEPVQAMAR